MSLAGISGRYSRAVHTGSTIAPILTREASMSAGGCACPTLAANVRTPAHRKHARRTGMTAPWNRATGHWEPALYLPAVLKSQRKGLPPVTATVAPDT